MRLAGPIGQVIVMLTSRQHNQIKIIHRRCRHVETLNFRDEFRADVD